MLSVDHSNIDGPPLASKVCKKIQVRSWWRSYAHARTCVCMCAHVRERVYIYILCVCVGRSLNPLSSVAVLQRQQRLRVCAPVFLSLWCFHCPSVSECSSRDGLCFPAPVHINNFFCGVTLTHTIGLCNTSVTLR